MIPDWLITAASLFLIVLMLFGVIYIGHIIVEILIRRTLPTLMDFYDRLKNPNDYK